MVKKKELELNLRIEEAYQLFEEEKYVQGMSKKSYYSELMRMLNALELKESDYVSVISDRMFNQYVSKMLDSNLSTGTINHNIRSVKVFLYWCMEHEFLSPYKIRLVKGQEEQLKFATEEEIEKLLKVKNHDDFVEMRTYTIICFILATGARSSTVRNIRTEDVDFKNHTVTYRHLKNKKVAVIPLTNQIERILHSFIKTWDTQSDFLFPDIKGGQLTSNALKLSFVRYSKRRGLRAIYPHSLRHSFSRMFVKNGGNAFILQQFLTHSSITMTQRYVKLFSEDIRESGFESYNPLSVISSNKSRTKVVTKNV